MAQELLEIRHWSATYRPTFEIGAKQTRATLPDLQISSHFHPPPPSPTHPASLGRKQKINAN